ncbi:MAG: hypothetical protein J5608_01830, partial [Alphaproteobacteria bacterium]|nr:hypothetical protein [Alphaproteobacteria bacterium]
MKFYLKSLRLCLLVLCVFAPAVAHAGLLPDGYKRLEYIQSDGKAYINTGQFSTGIVPTLNTKAEVKYSLTNAEGWPGVFGARTSPTSNAFNVWARINSTNVVGANFGSRSAI